MAKRSLFDQLDQAITQLLAGSAPPVDQLDPEIAPLVRIASELRDLPRTEFMERLKSELARSTAMATTAQPIAATRTVAAPRIAFKNAAKAIDFYKAAFGAREIMRFAIGEQIPHAEITIGDSSIMLTDEWPEGGRFSAETLGNSPVAMALSVPNVDAFFQHAVDAGATIVLPVKDQFYGRREGTLRDPFGYLWSVSTVIEEMSVEEMHRRMRPEDTLPVKKSGRRSDPEGIPHPDAVHRCAGRCRVDRFREAGIRRGGKIPQHRRGRRNSRRDACRRFDADGGRWRSWAEMERQSEAVRLPLLRA